MNNITYPDVLSIWNLSEGLVCLILALKSQLLPVFWNIVLNRALSCGQIKGSTKLY